MSTELADVQHVSFDVHGTPAPKGSGRAMLIGGRARFIAGGSSKNASALKSWDVCVRDAAVEAVGASVQQPPRPVFVGTALRVEICFYMRRPAGHWGKAGVKPSAPAHPAVKPDLDKLARATIDSLTGIEIGRAHV